ncbi:MAG: toprim domain-containing protein [Pseudomonadota bacterium]|nr:toprim domain-containing protein [Pseudomonadota bacterium]
MVPATVAAMHRYQASAKLTDSQRHGTGCELFLVEGDSAAGAVAAVRDARTQAVLPCQGKPLNAWRASAARVAGYPLYPQLAHALGLPSPTDTEGVDWSALRFERLVLLLDPDADGVHIGALMLLYLQRFAPALLAQKRVLMARAPLAGLRVADRDTGETEDVWAYTPEQARTLRERAAAHAARWVVLRDWGFRGLASLPPEVLHGTCVAPATRRADVVTPAQMQAVIDVFGGA